jgi:transcriptional regulator with XRE-family HTH domain
MSSVFCGFSSLFLKFFRKESMEAKGYTLKELAEALGIPEHTAHMRISRAGIDPLFRGAIYPPDTLDRIREAPMGRPPKTKPEAPDKPAKGKK